MACSAYAEQLGWNRHPPPIALPSVSRYPRTRSNRACRAGQPDAQATAESRRPDPPAVKARSSRHRRALLACPKAPPGTWTSGCPAGPRRRRRNLLRSVAKGPATPPSSAVAPGCAPQRLRRGGPRRSPRGPALPLVGRTVPSAFPALAAPPGSPVGRRRRAGASRPSPARGVRWRSFDASAFPSGRGAMRRPVRGPWRAGGPGSGAPPGSASGCGTRGSSSACDCSAERCVSQVLGSRGEQHQSIEPLAMGARPSIPAGSPQKGRQDPFLALAGAKSPAL